MKFRAGFLMMASALAMACSGGSDNNGAGGAGNVGNGAQNPGQSSGSVLGVKLGTDRPPTSAEGTVAADEQVVASETEMAPTEADNNPPDDSEPFPGEGSGAVPGGSCDTICHTLAGQCAAVDASEGDIHDCVESCEQAQQVGCMAQYARLMSCIIAQVCLAGTNELGDQFAAACQNDALSVYSCSPELVEDLDGTDVDVQAEPPSTPTNTDPTVTQACGNACTLALLAGCTELGATQDACVATCSSNPQSLAQLQACASSAGQ
jgi:hypothetical protein